MKSVTLSADDELIERARAVARSRRSTLSAAFRTWLVQFTVSAGDGRSFDSLMQHLGHVNGSRHYGREEMHER